MENDKKLWASFKPVLCGGIVTLLTSCTCSDTQTPLSYNFDGNSREEIAEASPQLMYPSKKSVTTAVAYIHPLKENKVKGKITFTKVEDGIKIVADIEGLKPGNHGFHVHEHGDCSGDGSAAGAHFNPTDQPHGAPDSEHRHVGDLGNVEADANGKAHYERVDKVIALEGKNSIVGKSIIIHEDRDDFHTQPAGASGARIACGIIVGTSL